MDWNYNSRSFGKEMKKRQKPDPFGHQLGRKGRKRTVLSRILPPSSEIMKFPFLLLALWQNFSAVRACRQMGSGRTDHQTVLLVDCSHFQPWSARCRG